MEETNKTTKAKKPTAKKIVTKEESTVVNPTPKQKKRLVLNDNDELIVRSNVFGELIYINDRTGLETFWENCGDCQPLSAKDVKDMKAKQQAFFKENWITITDAPDVDMGEYSMKDVYDALQIGKYYNDEDVFSNIDELIFSSESKLRKVVGKMNESERRSLTVCANEKILRGELDSIKQVKLLEEILNCELTSPDE